MSIAQTVEGTESCKINSFWIPFDTLRSYILYTACAITFPRVGNFVLLLDVKLTGYYVRKGSFARKRSFAVVRTKNDMHLISGSFHSVAIKLTCIYETFTCNTRIECYTGTDYTKHYVMIYESMYLSV